VFGSDGSPIVQYIVIFAVIFTVLAAIVFLVRRLTGGGTALQTRGARARQPRLGIVDVYELDRARQLILLRRDNVEHLLLVGGPNDVVVERNIQRGQRPLPESTLRPEPVAEPLPDPLAEAGRLPEPPRAIAETSRRTDPPFEMPVVVPAPVPGSAAAPPVRLPLDAALLGGDEPGQDLPAAPPSPPPLPPSRETFPRGRTQRPTVPVPERTPEPERPADPPAVEATVPPSLTPQPAEPRAVDPKVLSDMARQLQAAIARPSSAVTPPPEPAEPKRESLAAMMAAFERRSDSAAPAPRMSQAAIQPELPAPPPTPMPAPPPIVPAAPLPAAPLPAAPSAAAPLPVPPKPLVPPAPAPVVPPLPRTPPAVERTVPPPVPPRPDPAPPQTDSKTLANPFSVEEIEAEFARLLGRPLDKRG
jgi:hypothetical protein